MFLHSIWANKDSPSREICLLNTLDRRESPPPPLQKKEITHSRSNNPGHATLGHHDQIYLLRSSGTGQLDVPRQHTRSLSLIGPNLWNNLNKEIRSCTTLSSFNLSLSIFCYVLLDEHYVNSYNIYVCLHQYELSHFQHVYNILAFKFKLSLFCNYVMFIFMYVSIIMSTLCIYDFFQRAPWQMSESSMGHPL